ncbi:tyrosine-type recombinase/integrase [Candidatus Woesearchaeota archaeon]|nr:tyrosine-type recombinase/integrase [Candidatus Woesearchaeota archaeon]
MNQIKIDIHKTPEKYQSTKEELRKDNCLSERNKELILNFLRDAELGKTVLYKQKKEIGKRTCLKYLHNLKTIGHFLRKDFDKVSSKDMDEFIYALKDDAITKKNKAPYSSETKRDFKIILKKFYKWLLGNNEIYPDLVKCLDTFQKPKQPIAVTTKQVEKIVRAARTDLEKAVVSILFDLGARVEEFLNVRIENVHIAKNWYKIQLPFSKTFSRTLPLDRSIPYLKCWLQIHPYQQGQVFPISYNQCLNTLKRLGKQTLGIEITPQIIRHSKATQLAQAGVGRYQMCEWMGWAMSSKMPDRYIRREGIDNQKTLEMIKHREAQLEG